MEWINIFGLIFTVIILIPNIIFAVKQSSRFENKYKNKSLEIIEQIGRFGCFSFMIFNIPKTYFGWRSNEAFTLYLILNTLFVTLYCVIWFFYFKKPNLFKALALSIIPSVLFLFSGIITRSALLVIASVLFAPSHIIISYKNAK